VVLLGGSAAATDVAGWRGCLAVVEWWWQSVFGINGADARLATKVSGVPTAHYGGASPSSRKLRSIYDHFADLFPHTGAVGYSDDTVIIIVVQFSGVRGTSKTPRKQHLQRLPTRVHTIPGSYLTTQLGHDMNA